MPLEILTGSDVPALLKRAQQQLGEDAVVMSVRRVREGGRQLFEMIAADPRNTRQCRYRHVLTHFLRSVGTIQQVVPDFHAADEGCCVTACKRLHAGIDIQSTQ